MKNHKIISLLLAVVLLLGLLPGTAFAAEAEFGWISFLEENYQGQKVVNSVHFDWIGEKDEMLLSDIKDFSLTRDGEPVNVRLVDTADTLNIRNQWWNDTQSGTSFKFDFSERLAEPGWYEATFTYKGQTYTSGYPFEGASDSIWEAPIDAILIGSEAELRAFAEAVNRGDYFNVHNVYAKLTQDIELADGEWTPIGEEVQTGDGLRSTYGFSGTFDGGGHKITGVKIGSKENPSKLVHIGLFAFAPRIVLDLSVEVEIYVAPVGWDDRNEGVHASCARNIGGLAARAGESAQNCRVSGLIEIDGFNVSSVGGLFGDANEQCVVRDCLSAVTIRSECVDVGGLIGSSYASVIGCGATGDVSGLYAGGLIGSVERGYIENCYATGNVTTKRYIGPSDGSTSDCSAGGLIGRMYANSGTDWGKWNEKDPLVIRNSFASGDIADLSEEFAYYSVVGGFIGRCEVSNGSIENCYALGNVSGHSSGGFAGSLESKISTGTDSSIQGSFFVSHCFAAGNVTAEAGFANGFAARNIARIVDCAALGDVTGAGAMGFASTIYVGASIERCYSAGNVTATDDKGGASAFGSGISCYATGNASGKDVSSFSDGKNCYYTGVLTGGIHNLSKSNYGDMTVCPDAYKATPDAEYTGGKATAEMQSQAFVDLLNADQPDKPWIYKAGSYPILAYNLLPVSASSSAGGKLIAPPYGSAGDEVILFAIPDAGYQIKTLQYNGIAIDGASFTMPDGEVAVTAEFEPVSAGAGNETSSEGEAQNNSGAAEQNPGSNENNDTEKNPINPVIYIGGGVVLLCLITALVLFIISRRKQGSE